MGAALWGSLGEGGGSRAHYNSGYHGPGFIRRGTILYILYFYLLTAIVLSAGDSGYFTCKQNMKLVTTRFKSGGLHEKHVVATWNVGNRLSICL